MWKNRLIRTPACCFEIHYFDSLAFFLRSRFPSGFDRLARPEPMRKKEKKEKKKKKKKKKD